MKENDKSQKIFFSFVIENLNIVEFASVFLPLFLMIGDLFAGYLIDFNFINYGFIGSYGYIYGSLALMVLIALLLSLIKDSALGADNSLSVFGLSLPKNTTELIQESYSRKLAKNESVQTVIVFVFFELVLMFLYGTILAILILKLYLWRYVNL